MNKPVIAVHGGAGPDSAFIKANVEEYKKGIQAALDRGYRVLESGGNALDAVEAAVVCLEDNALFNAGRGAALNEDGEVELEAALMNGVDKSAGAVCLVQRVKNPVLLARAVLHHSPHLYLGGKAAEAFAQERGLPLMPAAYFITDHAFEQYAEAAAEKSRPLALTTHKKGKLQGHGTVGAVAVDKQGNLAAATSTGGTECKQSGRIGDSSVIGSGCYADNQTCAVSSTGDGEVILQQVLAFRVAALMQYKGLGLDEACRYLLQEELKDVQGDMGFVAVDAAGNVALPFKAERMHRGYRNGNRIYVDIYAATEG